MKTSAPNDPILTSSNPVGDAKLLAAVAAAPCTCCHPAEACPACDQSGAPIAVLGPGGEFAREVRPDDIDNLTNRALSAIAGTPTTPPAGTDAGDHTGLGRTDAPWASRYKAVCDACSVVQNNYEALLQSFADLRRVTHETKSLTDLQEKLVKQHDGVLHMVGVIHKAALDHVLPGCITCPECGAAVDKVTNDDGCPMGIKGGPKYWDENRCTNPDCEWTEVVSEERSTRRDTSRGGA